MSYARIDSIADLENALAALLAADPRLVPLAEMAGPLPLRRRAGGFEGLAAIVTAQQISDAAADSIWARFRSAIEPFDAATFLAADEADLRGCGLSRPKIRTLTAIGEAIGGGLDLEALHDIAPDDAIGTLTAINGIGPWTAEIYLLFCVGHPDILPAGDLALQAAVEVGFGLEERPSEKALREIGEAWSPWRGVAARLLWAYYRAAREARRNLGAAAPTRKKARKQA